MGANLTSGMFEDFELLSSSGIAVVAFVLHKFFVKQKDNTIKLLEVANTDLKYRLEQAHKLTPDALAASLTKRVKDLTDELERLHKDKVSNQDEIVVKQALLAESKGEIESLTSQIADAQNLLCDFICPQCQAPLSSKALFAETVEQNGREFDVEHEFIVYTCGYAETDGVESNPCEKHKPRASLAKLTKDLNESQSEPRSI